MEHLLDILNRITPDDTLSKFEASCEGELWDTIEGRDANYRTADLHVDFVQYYHLFYAAAVAAFNVRDGLRRKYALDLTPELVVELESDLNELSAFESRWTPEELETAMHLFLVVLGGEDPGLSGIVASCVGDHYSSFFLALHGLRIKDRISIATGSHNALNPV